MVHILRDYHRRFNMKNFCTKLPRITYINHEQIKPVCGTNCCIIGFSAHVFPNTSIAEQAYTTDWYLGLSKKLFGCSKHDHEWAFLFGSGWPNNRLETAARILHFLKHGLPSDWAYNYYLKFHDQDATRADYITALNKYIIN